MGERNVIKVTLNDLKSDNFERFLLAHEAEGYQWGFLKLCPPPEFWADVQIPNNFIDRKFLNPCRQRLTKGTRSVVLQNGTRVSIDFYTQTRIPDFDSTLQEFKAHALSRELMGEFKERTGALFWEDAPLSEPIYADEVEGSLCSLDTPYWSLSKLNTLFHRMCSYLGLVFFGVTTPYLYYGNWLTKFCWHVEDLLLFSMSFLHEGAPKNWYLIPPANRHDFEALVRSLCPNEFNPDIIGGCENFLHHKTFLLNPSELEKAGIPYTEVVQRRGEIVITFPGAYHCGFNHGFNCAEAVNFAMPSWLPYGREAKVCLHDEYAVQLSSSMMHVAQFMQIEFYNKILRQSHGPQSRSSQSTQTETFNLNFSMEPECAQVKKVCKFYMKSGTKNGLDDSRGSRPREIIKITRSDKNNYVIGRPYSTYAQSNSNYGWTRKLN